MTSDRLHAALVDVVGAAHLSEPPPLRDSTGRALGAPRHLVQPADTTEVARVVALCAAARAPIAPLGARTAYWSPLDLAGAVAIDVGRLRHLRVEDGLVEAGAGWPVRLLDQELRARGAHLPLHPDAFGDTQLGSMVATACTSGIGMGSGSLGSWLTGVELVTGTGTPVWTGAADRPGVPPFLREGGPDLTGLVLGSEGGLGVVTTVAFKRRPAPWRLRLSGRVADPRPLFPLGAALAGVYDTFRLQRSTRSAPGWALDLWIASSFSAREAAERAVEVGRRLAELGVSTAPPVAESAAARAGRSPDYDERWNGPLDGLGDFLARASLRGVDVNAPWSAACPVLQVLEDLVDAQRRAGVTESRLAVYAAPDFVNLGAHATVAPEDHWPEHADDAAYAALLGLPVVPYRVGRRWPRTAVDALGSRALLQAMKAACDPHGLLARGVGPWS